MALLEYRSLIKTGPYDAYCYFVAAKGMITAGDLGTAQSLLRSSLKLKKTAEANKWLGQLLFRLRRVAESLPYLKAAVKGLPNDPQLKFFIGGAYVLSNQQEKAQTVLQELQALSPDYRGTNKLKRMIEARWKSGEVAK